MPIFEKPKKIESIFKGNVPIDVIVKEGEKYIKDYTGKNSTDTVESIFAGFAKASDEDAKSDKPKETKANTPKKEEKPVRATLKSILKKGQKAVQKFFADDNRTAGTK